MRDEYPDVFPTTHRALFAARHDDAQHLDDWEVIRSVLRRTGVDDQAVFDRIDSGAALERIRAEHEQYVESHSVWGVPTFIAGGEAVFVRLMDRAPADSAPEPSIRTVERIIGLLTGWPALNEYKHTTIPR